MVLPVQSVPQEGSDKLFTLYPTQEENPTLLENTTETQPTQSEPTQNEQVTETPTSVSEATPQPGKIIDLASKHVEKISTLVTPDTTTSIADTEENQFIPKVEEAHNTAHEQHS